MRLNKFLSGAGVCARRKVADLLEREELCVNGVRVRNDGFAVDPHRDVITLNGDVLQATPYEYWMLHKPRGYISTVRDTHNRPTALSLIPSRAKLFPVGRLDQDTSGLILFTNDGDLALYLTHPRYEVPKTYELFVSATVTEHQLEKLRRGVVIDRVRTNPATVTLKKKSPEGAVVELTIREGKKRQIRRMCEKVHLPLMALKRVSVGELALGPLPVGKARNLSAAELRSIRPR